ncbi:MAG: A24 family peptidase [Turicibacter sp.]|nr:A24 family peptidase [Turicibacter sp.]
MNETKNDTFDENINEITDETVELTYESTENIENIENFEEPIINFSLTALFEEFGTLGKLVILVVLAGGLVAATMSVAATGENVPNFPILSETISAWLTIIFLLWLAMADFKHFKIPNKILLAWLVCRVVLIVLAYGEVILTSWIVDLFAQVIVHVPPYPPPSPPPYPPLPPIPPWQIPINSAIGAAAMGIFFLITYYLSKRTLGGGDVKLSFVLGLSLGINLIFSAVLYGLIICAVFSLGALLLKKLNRKDPVPLVPFLFAGTVLTYLMNAL